MNTTHLVLGVSWLLMLSAGPAAAQAPCDPLPPPAGPVIEKHPADADGLRAAVAGAATGTTIVLHDGTYDMSGGDALHRLVFSTPGVTLRSASGDREAVVLDAGYGTNELLSIQASDVTIADITLERASDHPIHISGPGVPISGVLIHNVHIIDPGEQAVKVNSIGEGTVDHSTLQCSHIELTDAGRPHVSNCYTGGLDAHEATGWLVRRNRIEGFWCDVGLSEHGIHMWRLCEDTVVEENLVIDCARGIGFGLGSGDDGHLGGVIRNNFVAAGDPDLFASQFGFDSGIVLWGAEGARVYHNSVASTEAPFSSIEWRYIATSVTLVNNLVSDRILDRGGIGHLTTNTEYAPLSLFVDVAAGDLHLVEPSSDPVGAGTVLSPGSADADFDGQPRDDAPDIGADEIGRPLFADGFESGDLSRWSAVGR
ncbi:MAG: right-handed parallel beta-helix repeat-containing protein [Thermoanaerobaculales bacterium]|nr:right-handed parallel beta-helix repeat-containing protein [Thermoanaerobaculales bacterium]